MRIDGITTCVGPRYAAHLAQTLPVWLETLDSLTIVTASGDDGHEARMLGISSGATLCYWLQLYSTFRSPDGRLSVVSADEFTKHGAHFNKGAALNVALGQARPTDWILSLDCDVLPPPNWREHLAEITPGTLYGCRRTDKLATKPWGYFQLWHASDDRAKAFAECYDHAGRYDAVFADGWPRNRRKVLPFTVRHLGEPARYWHGPGNEHLTRELLGQGVAAYRARDEKLTINNSAGPK